jgi:hypothetical protein
MAGRFEASVVINRPIEEVFAFLADGENDPKYASTVKDAGVKTKREVKLTEFEPPTRFAGRRSPRTSSRLPRPSRRRWRRPSVRNRGNRAGPEFT